MKKTLIFFLVVLAILFTSCSSIGIKENQTTAIDSTVITTVDSLSIPDADASSVKNEMTTTSLFESVATTPSIIENTSEEITTKVSNDFVYTPLAIYTPTTYGGPIAYSVQRSELTAHKTKKYNTPVETTITLGSIKISAELVEEIDYEWLSDRYIYLSKDQKIKYTKYSANFNKDSFTIQQAEPKGLNACLCEYPYDEITEENLIKHAKDYMSRYVDIDEFGDYVLRSETHGNNMWENGNSSVHTEPGIVASADCSTDPYFKPFSYTVSGEKFINGVRTSNLIKFVFDESGNIEYFAYFQDDLERKLQLSSSWGEKAFEETNIQKNIEDFLGCYTASGCVISDWHITDKELLLLNNKISMGVTINAKVTFIDSKHEVRHDIALFIFPAEM